MPNFNIATRKAFGVIYNSKDDIFLIKSLPSPLKSTGENKVICLKDCLKPTILSSDINK